MAQRVRALLVGAGQMGRAWAKNLTACDEVAFAGWVDIQPNAAAKAAQDLGITDCYTGEDLGRALAEVHPDFLVDVTIPEAHHDVTLQALAAGIPVLGEKPMSNTLERAREMVAASERAGKLYMVSQSRRYNAQLQAFRRQIAEHIDDLGILNTDFYIAPHFGGFREAMDSPLILDMAVHTFDAARYLCDDDPVAVYCEEFNPPWSWYRGAACATAIFEMSGGLRYTYRGSWCAEGRITSWEGEWRAVGSNGTATWDGHNPPIVEVPTTRHGLLSEVEQRTTAVEEIPESIAGSLRDFLHALKTGATPMGECHDNIKSLAMVLAAIESARTGKRIPIQV